MKNMFDKNDGAGRLRQSAQAGIASVFCARMARRLVSALLIVSMFLNGFAYAPASAGAVEPEIHELNDIELGGNPGASGGAETAGVYTFSMLNRGEIRLSELLWMLWLDIPVADIQTVALRGSGDQADELLSIEPIEQDGTITDYKISVLKDFAEAGFVVYTAKNLYDIRLTDGAVPLDAAKDQENIELSGGDEAGAGESQGDIYAFRMGDQADVLLSDILSAVGLDAEQVESVGLPGTDGAEGDAVYVEPEDGDYRITALRDFSEATLIVYIAGAPVRVLLLDGTAPVELDAQVDERGDVTLESETSPASAARTLMSGGAEGTYYGFVDNDYIPLALNQDGEWVYTSAEGEAVYGGTLYVPDEGGYKPAVIITAESGTKVYDGAALTLNSYTHTPLEAGDSFENVTITGSRTVVGTSNNVPSVAVIKNADGEDVTGSYDITYVSGTLEVTQKAVTITADDDTKEYDGTALTNNGYTSTALASGDRIASVTVTGSQTVFGTNNNVPSVAVIKNADDEDVTGSYDITYVSGTLSVTKKAVTITADNDTKEYDGTALTNNGYTNTALASGDRIVSVTVTGSQTVFGTNNNVPGAAKIVNADGEDVTGSYAITYVNGTLSVTKKAVTITADDDTKTYDGTALTNSGYTNTALAEGDRIVSVTITGSQTVFGTNNNVPSAAVIKNADDEDVTGSYDITYVSGTLEVTQKAVTITADDDEKVYDGTALTNDGYTNTDLAEGDRIVSVTITGSQTVFGTNNNVPSAAIIKNADDEDVTGSYDITYVNGILSVTKKAVTITADDDTKEYDGTALTNNGYTNTALAAGDRIVSVTVTGSQTIVGTNNNVPSAAKIVNGDGEDVTGSYAITYVNGTLSVTKKSVTITADDDEKVYDGTALTNNGYTNTALASGDRIVSVTITGSQTVVGTNNNVPSAAVIKNTDDEDVTGSYDITYVSGTLKVTKKAVTITADDDEKVYDGTALTNNGYTNTALAAGDRIVSVTVTGSQTIVGSSDNVPGAAVIKNADGEDVTACYAITYENGTLEVTPRPVDITAASQTKVYDGTALTNGGYTVDVDALVSGDRVDAASVVVTGSQTVAGEGANVASGAKILNAAGDDVTSNYAINYIDGVLKITQKPLTIEADDGDKDYDGTPLMVGTYDHTDLAAGDRIQSVTNDSARTDAGESPNAPTAAQIINGAGEDVTACYDITFVPGTLTVYRIYARVMPIDAGKVYGDADPALAAEAEGLIEGETLDALHFALKRAEGENIGDYTITVALDPDAHRNYDVDCDEGTFTITPATATVTADDNHKVYGGDDPALTATVTGLKRGDNASVISYTVSRDTGEDVDEYAIVPDGHEEQGNYIVEYVEGVFTITRAKATVTAKAAEKVYGDDDPDYDAAVEGLQFDDTADLISYDFTRAAGENVGEYVLMPIGDEIQDNYEVEYKGALLTITPATATVTAEAQTKVYGEDDPELTAVVAGLKNGDGEDAIAYTVSRAQGENVGEYAIAPAGAAAQGNYNVEYKADKLTITRAAAVVTANDDEKVYGSADPTAFTAEIDGLTNGDTEEVIQYTLSRAAGEGVGSYAIAPTGEAIQGNYDVAFAPGTFTITQRAVMADITGHSASAVYDGRAHSVSGYDIEFTVDDAETLVDEKYNYSEEYVRFDGTAEAERTDVGQRMMGLTADQFGNTNDNFYVTFTIREDGSQTITPRPVTVGVTGEHNTVNYDGTEYAVEGYQLETEDALYDVALNVAFSGEAAARRTDSGTTYMGLSAADFTNRDANFSVTFDVADGFIKINPVEITVKITGAHESHAYDGDEHEVSGYTASSESALYDSSKLDFNGTASASRTDAGTTYMRLRAADFSYDDKNVKAVFDYDAENDDGCITITPIDAEVTVTGNYDTSDYDGEPHTVTGYTATAEPALFDVDADIAFTGEAKATRTDVGTAMMNLSAEQFSNRNPNFANVTFHVTDGWQAIAPIEVTVTIRGNHAEFPYDGEEHTVTGYTAEADTPLYRVADDTQHGIEKDFTFSGGASATGKNAGLTNMNLSPTQFENHNDNFTNVRFEIEEDGYVEVTPISATVTIIGHTGTHIYDGEPHSVSGYDASYSTELYDESCFELLVEGSDTATGTSAGISPMNLVGDSFKNISPNFDDVTFDVTDGCITIDPAVTVSKYLNNVLAASEETFWFDLTLTDGDDQPIADCALTDTITTNAQGQARFSIAVAGMQTKGVTLQIPYGANLRVEEDRTGVPTEYTTRVDGEAATVFEQNSVMDDAFTVLFENAMGNVCRIGDEEFQTIASAIQWAQANGEQEIAIEMMVDYTMPATDVVEIPSDFNVTLSTASDYSGDGAATITRAPGFTNAMFTNRGTLNIGGTRESERVTIDGNGVEAAHAVIVNTGTLNLYTGGTIQNAVSTGNGGAIHSTGTVSVSGGSLLNNHAANGGAVYASENGSVNITGGSVTGNSASENGGAVYANDGTVTLSDGAVSGNTAEWNGGAVYSASGAVSISGTASTVDEATVYSCAISGNEAVSGSGGAIYADAGSVTIAGGALTGNMAINGNGGAVYAGSGGVSVKGGEIGGANRAQSGSAIYIHTGSATFSGGRVTGNIASVGGAVGFDDESARLFFSGSAYIQDNTNSALNEVCNVFLDKDTDLIINAIGLNSDAEIGIYVPNTEDGLYEKRGVSGARFGGYTNSANIGAFKNDRTPGMTVSEDNYKMKWGRAIKVELWQVDSLSKTSLPPTYQGNLRKSGEYFPTANDNYVSDIAAELMNTLGGISTGYIFACGFGRGATQYGECLTRITWNDATGDWGFVNRAGEFVTYDTDPPTLVLYYAAPAYITIANNTGYPLNLTSLTFNNIDVASNGFGFVVARKGTTVEHFVPVEASDLILDVDESIKFMFPGVRAKKFILKGKFTDKSDGDAVPYSYILVNTADSYKTGTIVNGTISANDAVNGFTIQGYTFNNNNTVEVSLGESTKICKIVELNADGTVREEHFYSTIQGAIEAGDANYDDYKVSVTEDGETYDTVKIEMIQDYLLPSTDVPDVPTGRCLTFTTATSGVTQGSTVYDGTGSRAVISQDQGNTGSFFKSSVGGANTAIIVENLNFEGKQLDATKTNGGVISGKDCSVTVRHVSFSNFTAGNGGAVYAQFGGEVKNISGKDIGACASTYAEANNWVHISDVTFENCVSKSSTDRFGGGGIWTNAKALTLSNCTFTNCTATQQGGAVYHRIDDDYAYAGGSTTTVSDCHFLHCSASAAGGLEINAYTITITGCEFDDCQAKSRNGGGFNAYLRDASAANTSLTITDTTFNNCFATQNGGVFRTMMNTYVTNCTFTNNTANGNGGGIAQDNKNLLSLNGCTVTGNKSGKMGGGIYANGAIVLENGCVITGNSLTTDTVTNGAGLYMDNSNSAPCSLTLGIDDPNYSDTCTISGNVVANGSASNLRLPESSGVNTVSVTVRCKFTTGADGDKLIHVLNAKNAGTQFGATKSGLVKPDGFKEGEYIFVADNNELYGVYDRNTGASIIWRGEIICKITDGSGNLLYFDQQGKDPAIFDVLDNNSFNPDMMTAFGVLKYGKDDIVLYYDDGSAYNAAKRTYCVMMLTDYTTEKYIATNFRNLSWQTIILTKAGDDDALYPYRGEAGTIPTIRRSTKLGNYNLLNIRVNMTLRDITVDGGSTSGVAANSNTRIVHMDPGSATTAVLTLGSGATLQNAKVSGSGGGVYLNWGSCLTINGGRIVNCTATGNGGAVYKDGGNGKITFMDGEVADCTATNGGAFYFVKHNSGIKSEMSGGSITGCTATASGGAVYLNNNSNNYFYMSGGRIVGNSAATAGGGIAVGGTSTKLFFSGDAVVYDNHKGTDGAQCNVELNQNSNALINTTGLGEDAMIGIYVSDTYMNSYGTDGKTFGRWMSDNSNLYLFINDRNDLRGARRPGTTDQVWWQEMHSLFVTKTVSSELRSDKNIAFNFTVKLINAVTDEVLDITETFGSGKTKMEFQNGIAHFTLKNGESRIALYVPGTISDEVATCRYEVTEEINDGFDTAVNNVEDIVKLGSFNEKIGEIRVLVHRADYTNTRKKGNLTVRKAVVSMQDPDRDVDFNFRVVLSTNEITGQYGDLAFSNGVATFTLRDGQSVTAENLPTGITYTVTETPNDDFDTDTTVNGADIRPEGVSLLAGDNNDVVFTNTRKVGMLKVVKNVSSPATADKNRVFNIKVKLTYDGEPVSHTYDAVNQDGEDIEGGITFDANGEHTFELRDGESVTVIDILRDTKYEVTEAVTGFTTKMAFTDAKGRVDNTGKIGTGMTTATITNTRQTGRLQIKKVIDSDRYRDREEAFTFVLTLGNVNGDGQFITDTGISGKLGALNYQEGVSEAITITGANTATVTGLPQDIDYIVTEQPRARFDLTAATGDTGKISAATSVATFTNTRRTGSLTITKTVESDAAADHEKPFSFSVKLGDSRINRTYYYTKNGGQTQYSLNFSGGNATGLTLKDGDSVTITGLPTDVTYTVTETAVSGFETTGTNAGGTIDETPATAAFHNRRNVGKLTVTNTVRSDLLDGATAQDRDRDFTFTVQLGSLNAQGQFVKDETIDEKTYGGMTFVKGESTFTLKHGESVTADNVPEDMRFVVTEQTDDDFTTAASGASGSISPRKDASAQFTNTRKTGKLVLTKHVVSDVSADKSQQYSFTITLGRRDGDTFATETAISRKYGSVTFTNGVGTLLLKPSTGSASATLTGLPRGIDYIVTEAAAANMDTEATGDTGTISDAADAEAVFTNTRRKGDLTIEKVLVSDLAADADVEFRFTVKVGNVSQTYSGVKFTDGTGTFALKGGQTMTLVGLPAGLSYTVTEAANDQFRTAKAGDKGTINENTPAAATFTNTRKTGSLRLTKRVDSDLASDDTKAFTFTVTLTGLTDAAKNKTYGDMAFTDGVATFTLTKDQYKTATGLPTALQYAVTESAEGFEVVAENATGEIGTEQTYVDFTNKRVTGDLKITKALVSDLAADATRAFSFTIVLDDESIGADAPNGKKFGDITFKNGRATFTLVGGQILTARALPAGIGYTVTETADADFVTVAPTNNAGIIPKGTVVEMTFTNTRRTGSLEISKAVVSDRAADRTADFTFTVTLSGLTTAARNKTYGGVAFKNGSAKVTLKHDQTVTIDGLPTGVGYTVRETQAKGFTSDLTRTGTVPSTGKATAEFENTRVTGDLKIINKLVSDLAADADVEFSFTVTLNDDSINKTYSGVEFINGVATDVKVKANETLTIQGLPTDVKATVAEVLNDAFSTSPKSVTRTITAPPTTVEAEFTNTRKTGKLTVTKTLSSKLAADKDTTFNFSVKFSGLTNADMLNDTFDASHIAFEDGDATVGFTLKGGEKQEIGGMPTEVEYTVTEVLDEAEKLTFQTVPESGSVSGKLAEKTTATITNIRKTGDLKLTKALVNGLDADADKEFTITVKILKIGSSDVETAINTTYGDVTFRRGTATFKLKPGTANAKTIKGLPVDYRYVVTESTASGFLPAAEQTGTILLDQELPVTVTNVRAVCKITDAAGKLLYVNGKAAAYGTLKAAFDDFGSATFDNGGTPVYIKMLVPAYTLTENITVPQKAVTLTTASKGDRDGFPGPDGTAIVKRGVETGALFTVGENADIRFTDITVDGNGTAYTPTVDGGLLRVNGGAATLGAGATLQNASVNGSGGAAYVTSGTLTVSGGTIIGNSASVSGGGIAVGAGAKLHFEGDARVIGNTANAHAENVCLSADDNAVINARNIGSGAQIGVYVPTALFDSHGDVHAPFGTYVSDANLSCFVNDISNLTGWACPWTDEKLIVWGKEYTLEVAKTVNGSAADQRDEAFAFTVTVELPNKAHIKRYTANMIEGNTPAVTQSGNTVTLTVSLKHGEHVLLKKLPHGTQYNIEETMTETQARNFYLSNKPTTTGKIGEGDDSRQVEFINQRRTPITLTADSAEKVYDGAPLTKQTYKITEGQLANGDQIVEGTIKVTGTQTNVGTAPNRLDVTGIQILNADNDDVTNYYAITTADGTLTVTPRPVTVKADDKTKVYDKDATTDPKLTATVTGAVTGDAINYTLSRVSGQNVGNYAITVTPGENPNYDVTVEGGTFSITPRAITVKADDKTKVYDNDATTDPKLTATVTGAVTGDAINYTLSRVSGQNVGDYAITVTAGENPNYTVTVEGGTFSITPKAITVKADDKTKVYDNDATTDPKLTATVTGAVEGDTINYTLSRVSGQNVGDYAITVTAGENPNYTVTVEGGTFSITPKAITVKADDKTKVYDNDATTDPKLTATVTGAVTGDAINYTLSRVSGQNVDDYAITVTAGENPNYTVTVEGGTFSITPKAITVKADDKTKVYDNDATTDPKLTATVQGAVTGDAINYTLSRVSGQNVGDYAITVTPGENPNYTVTVEGGTFSITRRSVTVKADDKAKYYDLDESTDPAWTATVDGLINGDTIDYALNCEHSQKVGTYEIVPTGATEQGNYRVTYEKGTFTISRFDTTVKIKKVLQDSYISGASRTFQFTATVERDGGALESYNEEGFVNGVKNIEISAANGSEDYVELSNLPVGVDLVVEEAVTAGIGSYTVKQLYITEVAVDGNSASEGKVTIGNPNTETFELNNEREIQFTNKRMVCKITYSVDDNIRRFYNAYTSLKDAFDDVNYGNGLRNAEHIQIEMLVQEYGLSEGLTLNGSRDITLTTANASGDYPYTGSGKAKIMRTTGFAGAMFTVAKDGALTVDNIVLDGNNVSAGDGIVNVAGSLTITSDATLQNANTSGSGGAIYATGNVSIEGGQIINNTAANGGAVYMAAGTLTMSGSPVLTGNKANAGTGIYLTEGSTLRLQGSPNFGSEEGRQDIHIAGYVDSDAASLVVTGALNVDPGAIRVWANEKKHYYSHGQFASFAAGVRTKLENNKQLDVTLHAFRNAQANSVTDCTEDYLTGRVRLDPTDNNIYWTGTYPFTFMKVDGFDEAVKGATFALYTKKANVDVVKSKSDLEAYKVNDQEVTAESGADGRVTFAKVPPEKELYMMETEVPVVSGAAYEVNDTIYRLMLDAEGVATLKTEDGTEVYKVGSDYHIINVSKYSRKAILRKVKKQSDNGYTSLKGKVFTLKAVDRQTVIWENVESGDNGIIWVGMLPLGIYYLYEDEPAMCYKVTVSESGVAVGDGVAVTP